MIKLRKIFFYFIPWMGRKFWQKITNGTGTLVAAGRTVIKVVMFIPSMMLAGLIQYNNFYINALRTEPAVLKFLIVLLTTVVSCMISLFMMLMTAAITRGEILPQPGIMIKTTLCILAIYNVYALLAVAYQEFEQEQRHMLNNLSDENLNDDDD